MLVVPAVTATEEESLTVEYGDLQTFCKCSTIQQGDITFLPIREVFTAYGVQLTWAENEAENKIIMTTGAGRYQLVIDYEANQAMGLNKTYDIKTVNHKVYLPVNFYADVMNCEVMWDGGFNRLMIDSQVPVANNVAVGKAEAAKDTQKIIGLPPYEKTTASRSMGASEVREKAPTVTYYQEGIASWYGNKFHGKKTSSGAAYDMNAYTAAHTTLPFGTVVKVTALYNGASVDVTINDRGPFVSGRVIDLSRAAAEQIGLVSKGVGQVKLEVIQ